MVKGRKKEELVGGPSGSVEEEERGIRRVSKKGVRGAFQSFHTFL